ncbi:MAG: S49 family peptidase, partial [Gemmatimonadetes bacterium]|nr:S49 family peptidase [Gemmatimonadota bacterium]
MSNWNQILSEINKSHDQIRREYLKKLSDKTGRNTVCYYSGWLQKTGEQFFNVTTITDEDKAGFMSCFFDLDKSLGLDLLVHSPGGRVSATESLIHYIREIFGDNIRVFVPQLAMSGGTLLALMGKEIWMGKQSNLGPIDPQLACVCAVPGVICSGCTLDARLVGPGATETW